MRNLVWTLPSPTSRRYATPSDTSPSLLTNFTSSSPPMAALLTYSQTNPKLRFFSHSGPSLRCPSRPLIFCTNSSRLNDVSTVLKLHSSDGKRRAALMKAGALYATVSEPEPDKSGAFSNCRTILLSGVVVKSPRRTFGGGRRWNSLDVATAGVVLSMHVLSLFAPFCFNWSALCVALSLYFITGLFGITLSFHRNLSHRSFKLPKWLEYSFAYCGSLALQGSPIDWVSTHRYHHQFTDSERDPHSPIEGFWFSHISWLFDETAFKEKCGEPNNVMDLQKQSFYRFLQCTYIAHPIALGVLLFALGGLPFLVWGMGVRTVWVFHITWLVNSACHVWGKQAWNTRDLSRNNWWVALLAFGEGWHNNHHAFEFSARHGLEWWQLDMTWYVVRFLQAIGLATDVKLPTEIQKQKLSLKVES